MERCTSPWGYGAKVVEFTAGEEIEWLISDHQNMVLGGKDAAVAAVKTKRKKKST